ncbi:TonB-dependent receptor [Novosphingobium sp. ZN18A2]|uniref:TonB-dependent receptor n=1 Tax=Novosphingobium sp. ZN18A2 TaxID=3079861 RepID=UPI0030CCB2A6
MRMILMSGAAISAIAFATPAVAQEQPSTQAATQAGAAADAADDSNVIVVTAQFRSQNLQETPLAVSAFNSQTLEQKSYETITDLTDSAPNVVMKPTGSAYGPGAAIFIRGVGQYDSNFAFEPGVGLYVDDVYHGAIFGAQLDLLDLDRVEILRGPQGTLAGKNSIGGAVKLYTRKPGSGGSFLEATTGSRDRMDMRGVADIALVPDQLWVRFSGVTRHQDGYLTRYDYGCRNPGNAAGIPSTAAGGTNCVIGHEGGKDYTAGRLALRWKASDSVEVNIAASKLVDDSEPSATKLINLATPGLLTPGVPDLSTFLTPPNEYSNYSSYETPAFTDKAGSHPATMWTPNTRLRAWDVSGTVDIDLADNLALKLITAYMDLSGRYSTDFDTTPFGINTSTFTNSFEQFTQEARLNGSSFNHLLDWTVGAFYYKSTAYIEGGDIIAPGAPFESAFYSNDRIPSRSISGFVHGEFHLTDALTLTGGLRYTSDKKDYYFRRLNPFDTSQTSYTAQAAIDGDVGRYSGSRWDYRANLSYQFSPAVMGYAQISTGYRGGGINPRPFVSQQVLPFNPETLTAYEAGLKTTLFDRAVRFNLAGFINDYKNIIFTNNAPTVVNGVVISPQNATPTNAGDARLSGVEAELNARLGGFEFDGSASYLDFKLKSVSAAGATFRGITLDNVAPYITKWKVSAGAQYRAELGDLGSITPRLDFAYQSSFFINVDNNPLGLVDPYSVFNARITWRSADDDWEVAAAVTNLTNKFYYLNKIRLPIGITTGQVAAPRQWSLSLRRNF